MAGLACKEDDGAELFAHVAADDTPETFIDQLVKLYSQDDYWREVSQLQLSFARSCLSRAAQYRETGFTGMLRSLASRPVPGQQAPELQRPVVEHSRWLSMATPTPCPFKGVTCVSVPSGRLSVFSPCLSLCIALLSLLLCAGQVVQADAARAEAQTKCVNVLKKPGLFSVEVAKTRMPTYLTGTEGNGMEFFRDLLEMASGFRSGIQLVCLCG